VVPIRSKTSEQLISQDDNNNTYNYKYTFSVEIVPLCRDDVCCLPPKMAATLGNIGPLVLVMKVSNLVHVMDPTTLNVQEISSQRYYDRGEPFRALASAKQLVPYTILDVVPVGQSRGKYLLADVQLVRDSDFGSNDITFTARTHLGHLLHPGDNALGYDLSTANFNEADMVALKGRTLPDVFLVRKYNPDKVRKNNNRHWKLRRLDKEGDDAPVRRGDEEKEKKDYEAFLDDLVRDPDMRSRVNLYKEDNAEEIFRKNKEDQKMAAMGDEDEGMDEGDEDDEGEIGLEELLDDIDLDQDQDEDEDLDQ